MELFWKDDEVLACVKTLWFVLDPSATIRTSLQPFIQEDDWQIEDCLIFHEDTVTSLPEGIEHVRWSYIIERDLAVQFSVAIAVPW